MIEIVGVSLRRGGKVYFFSPNGLSLKINDNVIVKTERGLQFGIIVSEPNLIEENKLKYPLSEVVKICSKNDIEQNIKNTEDAKKALKKCKNLVEKYNLNMMILDANYTFDRSQLLFTFIADNRIDFRNLAKDLASIYKTII